MFSCFKSEIVQYESANQDPFTFNSGQQLTSLPRSYTDFCVVSKTCKFLAKYDETIWADDENLMVENLLGKIIMNIPEGH